MNNKAEPFNLIKIFPLLQLGSVTFRPTLPYILRFFLMVKPVFHIVVSGLSRSLLNLKFYQKL